MKAIFTGSSLDKKTAEMGLCNGGEYTILLLERTGFWTRFFTGVEIMATVKAFGRIYRIPYGSITAFDQNWRLK